MSGLITTPFLGYLHGYRGYKIGHPSNAPPWHEISNGFTQYPQKQDTYRFFKGELAIPTRIIILDGSGSISFDVLAWLSEQNVPLIRIDWQGNVQSVLANNGYAANPYRVEWQRETHSDLKRRMAFCIDLVTRKIDGCIKTLEKSVRRSDLWEKAMERAYADLTRLECDSPRDVVALRALEAGSAAAYFRAWREIPLQWKGTNQRPIPESWHRIGSRTSLFHLAGNRNAAHPVNAMLNYAYAILESQMRIQLVCGDDSKDRYRDRYLREKRNAQKSGMTGVLEMLNWRFGHERTLGPERSVCTAALAGGQLMPANQALISSHGKLLRSRAVVMSVAETPGR